MKILVIGGMHGNEPLGIELVRLLIKKPIPGISTQIANPRAVASNTRFIEQDMNRVFPGNRSGSYEQRRAANILKIVRQYEIVLDFHNTLSDQPSCGFVGPRYDPILYTAAGKLGLNRVIIANYGCINKFSTNCLSVEICARDSNAVEWYDKLLDFQSLPQERAVVYSYLQRITWELSRQLQTPVWRPFAELPVADKEKLDINGSACPIFIGSTLTEYYATLISRESSGTIKPSKGKLRI